MHGVGAIGLFINRACGSARYWSTQATPRQIAYAAYAHAHYGLLLVGELLTTGYLTVYPAATSL